MKLKDYLVEEAKLQLHWEKMDEGIMADMLSDHEDVKQGKKSKDEAVMEGNDWPRYCKDLCKILKVSSISKIWCVDNDSMDDAMNTTEAKFYEAAFQDVFGVSAEHGDHQNFKCPEGYTEHQTQLSIHSTDPDEKDVLDADGITISKNGKPKLFISYPYGAGIYLHWVK